MGLSLEDKIKHLMSSKVSRKVILSTDNNEKVELYMFQLRAVRIVQIQIVINQSTGEALKEDHKKLKEISIYPHTTFIELKNYVDLNECDDTRKMLHIFPSQGT